MKKFLLGLGLCFLSGSASAFELTFEKGYSSHSVVGVKCDTGTVVNIAPANLGGYNIAGYRIQNQDTADAVWLGGPSVATSTVSGDYTNLGEKLVAGADGPFPYGYDQDRKTVVELFCKAADAAGTAGVILSRAIFYYK